MIRRPPRSPLFPNTTLSRSAQSVVLSPFGIAQNLVASNPNPVVSFSDPLPGTVNLFTTADPQKWVTQIPRYATADRKSTRLNSSHLGISYAVFCLYKKIQMM